MSAHTEKELQQLKKRLLELAQKSYMQNIYCFTDFLGMAQIDAFYQIEREISHVPYTLYGGNTGCERVVVRFGSGETLGYEEPFPITCLLIKPASEKFADDLTHRDFLGACMNLGIERGMIGDILVRGKAAYLYCMDRIAPYIADNLTKVKHTYVRCSLFEGELESLAPVLEKRECQAASERLDGVIAKLFRLSREKSLLLFREKRIFVNGRQQENNSSIPRSGDIVSVRGYGKFIYRGKTRETRKGRCNIQVEVYV